MLLQSYYYYYITTIFIITLLLYYSYIIGELHRAKKIAPNIDRDIKQIVNKYTAAGFPSRYVHSIIDNFDSGKDNLIIPQWLLYEREAFTIHLTFSPSNESFVKTIIRKLNYFTNEKA